MKLPRLFKKKKTKTLIKGSRCLNCGCEFKDPGINFCPDCGQPNDQRRVSVSYYLSEFFSGFFSFDNHFIRTIIPLIFKPGKVTKEYIEGKRTYYANPFRMYLNISIVFFLLIGLFSTIDDLRSKKTFDQEDEKDLEELDSLLFTDADAKTAVIDSIAKTPGNTQQKPGILIDSVASVKILDTVSDRNIWYNKIGTFVEYDRDHKDTEIDEALSDLGYENNFWNHFYYTRAQNINKFLKDADYRDSYADSLISKLSVAIFFLLPVFTFFVWLFYLRKPYTYSEHMVFVFQAQTVMFVFLIIDLLVENLTGFSYHSFLLLFSFLVFLFLSMKRFYQQGWFVTLIKMSSLTFIYVLLAAIGGLAISVLAFIL